MIMANNKPRDWARELIKAAGNNDLKIMEIALAMGADVNARDSDRCTALMFAAVGRNLKAVEMLISRGADVNAKNLLFRTPLMCAANQGNREILETLIANGADVNAVDRFGNGSVDFAIRSENFGIASLLRSHIESQALGKLFAAPSLATETKKQVSTI